MGDAVAIAKDIVQIVFWSVATVVAVLTYRGARRTLLQPIRTELFKAQYEAMSPILALFVGKTENDLEDDFGFRRLKSDNMVAVFDQYATTFFGKVKTEPETRPYDDCTHAVMALKPDDEVELGFGRGPDDPSEASVPPEVRWEKRYRSLYVNDTFVEAERRLREFLENPLLPRRLVELLTQYREAVEGNKWSLLFRLDEVAKELPSRCRSLEELSAHYEAVVCGAHRPASFYPASQTETRPLKPIADQIVEFTRSYFDAGALTKNLAGD